MITLWYLAYQDSMRTISVKFGVAKSSVTRSYTRADIFFMLSGVIGAIDGCHIPIKAPSSHQEDYNNRKMTHTVILQAVCDSHGVFTDCFAGVPGSAHDARVFSHSNLSQSIQSNVAQHFPDEKYHLVGYCAYALKKWLMVPYKDHGNLKMAHLKYNRKQSQTRIVIEIAFGHLKNRFRRLKYIDSKIENIPHTIMSACVLHNFCKYHDVQDIVESDDSYGVATPQPTGNTSSTAGSLKRDAIANSL
ncbi:putative nuclease HARBI1 [Haliotis cracherodii]|uniref:putative nuclease HARBI1 n=1 Tax=Haliotis cracherodii TaxID=6455 RepID=UPI0039EA2204